MATSTTLTRNQVAALFKVSVRTVTAYQKLNEDPLPVLEIKHGGSGNKYDAAAVFEWGVRRRLREAASGNPDASGVPDYQRERARLTQAKANKAELELEEVRGRLLDANLVEKAWASVLANFRARILALPSKAAPRVAPMTSVPEIRASLKSLCNEALHELASRGIGQSVEADLLDDIQGGKGRSATA